MARAEVASASVQSDSIKGLAQSIAKPAYRRLLTAEPALRRAVAALIIAFPLTICVGIARAGRERTVVDRRLQGEIDRLTPAWLRATGRRLLVTNSDGVIVAG